MGCLPIQLTAKLRTILGICVEQENKDSILYNQKLVKKLPEIQASLPGSKFLYANVYDPVMDMIRNPSKYGIYNFFPCSTSHLNLNLTNLCNIYSSSYK